MADRDEHRPAPPGERDFARGVLADEAQALHQVAQRVGDELSRAINVLEDCISAGGTVLVTGLGKSGLIGAKIAATFSSLGIPAHSVHPVEAAHGDLGRFRRSDAVLALSASGETEEVVELAGILRQDGLRIISITNGHGGAPSSLERLSFVSLTMGIQREAGSPDFIAPTSSTTVMLAIGDALALCLARRRNVTDADFARWHPGGSLGGLLRPVVDVLRFRAPDSLPVAPEDASVEEALRRWEGKGRRPGALLVVDPRAGTLTGIFTDGDLRRLVLRDPAQLGRPIREVMTRGPRTLPSSSLVRDAVHLVREHRQDEIPVIDDRGAPVGLLDVQDLMAMRLVRE